MGRPWPQPGEPLFTERDTAEILEYLEDERLVCEGCGQPKVESMAEENEFAYEATVIACHACGAKSRAASKLGVYEGIYAVVEKKR